MKILTSYNLQLHTYAFFQPSFCPQVPTKPFPMAHKLWSPNLGININKSYQYKDSIEAN